MEAVGVHVRRTDDIAHLKNVYGIRELDRDYFSRAMRHVARAVEGTNGRKVVFVFSSDDMDWCRESFSNASNAVMIEGGGGDEEERSFYDMAVLSLCQHHIIR